MPGHQPNGHGYIQRELNDPKDGAAAAAAVRALPLPAGVAINTVSQMEDPGNASKAGKTMFIFIDSGHPAPAHAHVQQVATLIDTDQSTKGYFNALAGLANHWCCYSDD
jgi:hypothetical protein